MTPRPHRFRSSTPWEQTCPTPDKLIIRARNTTPTAASRSGRPPRVDAPTGQIAHALARGCGLTDRDHRVIAHLARHRVLTALQLARLEFGSYSHARTRLAQLHQRGIL